MNNIPQPPSMEGLYQMIQQLQDQNRKLSAEMAAMNQENSRREMRLAVIRIMMTPLVTRRTTIPTILVEKRKPIKRPLLRPVDILGAIFGIYHVCGPLEEFQATDHIETVQRN